MEQVKLVYFTINRCGYYCPGSPELAFGGLAEVLTEIKAWIHGRKMRQTKAFDPEKEDPMFPVYIADMAIDQISGNAVIVTWNETPSINGKVAAAAGDDLVGNVGVSLVGVPENSIPGFPCYFFFITSRSTVLNLRFEDQNHGGQPGMARYIHEFMGRYSSHVQLKQNDDGVEITAYIDKVGDEASGAFPSYRTRLTRVPGKVDWLRERCADIRKLVRKDDLGVGGNEARSRMNAVWKWLNVEKPTVPAKRNIRFHFELDCSLTEDQFATLVQFEAEEHDSGKDIGFKLTGSSEVHWLSSALVKQAFEIDVTRSTEGTVSAIDLLKALSKHLDSIVSEIPNGQ